MRGHVALRPRKRQALPDILVRRIVGQIEQCKTRTWAEVEYPFHRLANRFDLKKARYRGLARNIASLFALFTLINLCIAERGLLVQPSQGRPEGSIATSLDRLIRGG